MRKIKNMKIPGLRRNLLFLLALSLFVAPLPLNQAQAFFGPSKCEKAKSQIIKLESKVNQRIRSLANVGFAVPISSPLVTSIYSSQDNLETALIQIRKIGENNPKCYNSHQLARFEVRDYWDKDYYVDIYPGAKNLLISMRYSYIGIYSKTLK